MNDEPHTTLRYTVTDTEQNTIHEETDADGFTATVTRPVESTLSARQEYSGLDDVAEIIFRLANEPNEVHEEITSKLDTDDYTKLYDGTLRLGEPEVTPTAVYLAARKYAAVKTRSNMIRTGYSIEQVLVWWIDSPDWSKKSSAVDEIQVDGLNKAAKGALLGICLADNHTPGADIEGEIPDYKHPDFDKEEMAPVERLPEQ